MDYQENSTEKLNGSEKNINDTTSDPGVENDNEIDTIMNQYMLDGTFDMDVSEANKYFEHNNNNSQNVTNAGTTNAPPPKHEGPILNVHQYLAKSKKPKKDTNKYTYKLKQKSKVTGNHDPEVNQFRLNTVDNKFLNLEFYLSNGNLSGNGFLNQALHLGDNVKVRGNLNYNVFN